MPIFLPTLTKSRNELAHRVHDHIVELGLSANELLVMWASLDPSRPTAATIRKHLGMRQSTFNSLVARLVARGYLRTRPCLRDRRTRYLNLTRPGFTAVMIARSIHRDIEAMAQPFDRAAVEQGLARLAFLASLVPQPILMEDGLPAITA
jgi:DNA-binding MarR family transcriptional regulator